MSNGCVGQVKAVLVVEGKGVVTSVHAREVPSTSPNRLVVTGEVSLPSEVQSVLEGRILRLVDEISSALGKESSNYELTIRNVSAASVGNLSLTATGRSLDCAMFLALLSARLKLRIRQDTVFTGQIASADGHLAPVTGIPEKIAAVAEYKKSSRLAYPDYSEDNSLKSIAPDEYRRVSMAIREHSKQVRGLVIRDILDLVKSAVSDIDICFAALDTGFFQHSKSIDRTASPHSILIQYLLDDNESRFWQSLERCLLEKQHDTAQSLVSALCAHFIQRRRFPVRFGGKLRHLLISMPPPVKRALVDSPIISMRDCIQLSQFASEQDHDEVSLLFRAIGLRESQGTNIEPTKSSDEPEPHGCLLQQFLDELSPDNIARQILLPIDNGRASYVMDSVTVQGHSNFLDSITSFYAHLLRHMGWITGSVNSSGFKSDALGLVGRAFLNNGGDKAAYVEATNGTKGGLRYIFDTMADRLKVEERDKYIRMILKTTIDPLDFESRTAVVRTLLSRIQTALPENFDDTEPERLVAHIDILVQAYSESVAKFMERLRLL